MRPQPRREHETGCWVAAGEFFTLRPEGDLPGHQRTDDAGSLTFRTGVLDAAVDIVGRPRVRLRLSIDAPSGNIAVRLVDVHPEGVCHRVSLATLNLAHRNSNSESQNRQPGRFEDIELQ